MDLMVSINIQGLKQQVVTKQLKDLKLDLQIFPLLYQPEHNILTLVLRELKLYMEGLMTQDIQAIKTNGIQN